jgi:hypothetical protein
MSDRDAIPPSGQDDIQNVVVFVQTINQLTNQDVIVLYSSSSMSPRRRTIVWTQILALFLRILNKSILLRSSFISNSNIARGFNRG